MALVGALIAGGFAEHQAVKRGAHPFYMIEVLLYGAVGVFLGGHLLYGLVHIRELKDGFLQAFGGQVFYGGLLGGLSSLDPKMLSAAAGLIGQFNSGDDDQRVALLNALRPFVKEQRYAKLDKAIQIAKLSRLIRSGLELFRAQKESAREEEGGHV